MHAPERRKGDTGTERHRARENEKLDERRWRLFFPLAFNDRNKTCQRCALQFRWLFRSMLTVICLFLPRARCYTNLLHANHFSFKCTEFLSLCVFFLFFFIHPSPCLTHVTAQINESHVRLYWYEEWCISVIETGVAIHISISCIIRARNAHIMATSFQTFFGQE